MKELTLTEHLTPYTSVPETSNKFVRLKKKPYKRGYYRMEGVDGYEMFRVKKPITVTSLQVNCGGKWITLMVDDPMHLLGMEELAKLCKPGKVLVTGLGLGLVLHPLCQRSDITEIEVIEIDPEVVDFISPYLPKDSRIKIRQDNFFPYLLSGNQDNFNSVIIDLWVLNDNSTDRDREQVKASMLAAYNLSQMKFPEAEVLVWGIRGYKPRSSKCSVLS